MGTKNNKNMKVSVLICCYNSAIRIRSTLEALAAQKCKYSWEIVLINNNSTDKTEKICRDLWEELNCSTPFKIVDEYNPGLSAARKKGIIESVGEYIIFCDDDNHLASDYIESAVNIMDYNNEIGALCGYNEPIFEIEPPNIVKDNINSYACGALAKEATFLNDKIVPWGAGLVVRSFFFKKLLDIGFESILSDRKGNELSSGGDTEFCYLLKLAGFAWRYDTSLHLYHELPSNRLTFGYLKKLRYSQGKALVAIDWYYKFGNSQRFKVKNSSWLKIFISQLFRLFTHRLSLPISRNKRLENLYQIGYITQLWKERKNFRYNELYVKDIIEKIREKKKALIAIDTVFLKSKPSGISFVWTNLLENLETNDFEIILLRRKNSKLSQSIRQKFKMLEIEDFNYSQELNSDVTYLNQICKENFVDYFISTYYTYCTAVPNIVYIHDLIAEIFSYDFEKPMWKQKKLCIKNGSSFICISKTTQKDFKSIYGKENSYLVYNSFDPSRFSVLDDSILGKLGIKKPYFIILPTNNDEYKNIQLIKKLFESYPEIFDRYEFICLSNILDEFPVKIAFQISDPELTSLYSRAKGVLYPSKYEGFGLPILEAKHFEIPIFVCENPSSLEFKNNYCIYNDADNPKELYNNLTNYSISKSNVVEKNIDFTVQLQQKQFTNAIRSIIQ